MSSMSSSGKRRVCVSTVSSPVVPRDSPLAHARSSHARFGQVSEANLRGPASRPLPPPAVVRHLSKPNQFDQFDQCNQSE